jgi:hypothetical protein
VLLPRLQLGAQQEQQSYHQASLLAWAASFDHLVLPDTHHGNSTVTQRLSAFTTIVQRPVVSAMLLTSVMVVCTTQYALYASIALCVLGFGGMLL